MKKQIAQSGFSLVEMMVAITIFMVVAVVAVAALLKIVDADRKSKTLQDTVNNINFAMDSITREIRVGSAYTCEYGSNQSVGQFIGSTLNTNGVSCPSISSSQYPYASIAFLSSNTGTNQTTGLPCSLVYSYYFAPTASGAWTIEKAQQNPNNHCTDSLGSTDDPYAPIIDPNIIITAYSIKVVEANSLVQPSVFLYISGYTGNADKTKTYFDLQTTISERI
jgi:type II secretory pathway pseudopilin PulG